MSYAQELLSREPGLPHRISEAIAAARASGHSYILSKPPEEIADALQGGRAAIVGNDNGRRYYGQLSPIITGIVEFGGMVRFGGEQGESTAGDVVRDALQLPFAAGKLVIGTVRSPKSLKALADGGMTQVEWGEFPNIRAATCDPTCAPGPEAGMLAWVACGQSVACNACSISLQPTDRDDTCNLMVGDIELARHVETDLNAQFGGDALTLRTAYGLDLGLQPYETA